MSTTNPVTSSGALVLSQDQLKTLVSQAAPTRSTGVAT